MGTGVSRGAFVFAVLLVAAPQAAPALDLAGAFREVAGANPMLAGQRRMAEAAHRRVAPAGAWSSPMLELGALNVPTDGRFDMEPMTMKMVGIQQRVPVFGANGLERRSAGAAARAEDAAVETTAWDQYAMTWAAYADAWHAASLVTLGLAHRDDMERLVRSARARYESGNGRLDDVLRAEAEQARTFADLAAYQAEEAQARARLAALMGRDGAALADSLEAPPVATLPPDAGAVLAAVNDAHPRLRGLRAQSERWRFAARASRRMLWPDLQLGFSYATREPIMGRPQDDMWSATVGVMLPVFAAQRELSEAAGMDAMAQASDADLRAAMLELDQQARGTLAGALAARRTVALMADTVVVTQRRAVAASWSAYEAGATDLWRVLEATHALYEDEVGLVRARQQLARAESKLLSLTADGRLLGLGLPAIGTTDATGRNPR